MRSSPRWAAVWGPVVLVGCGGRLIAEVDDTGGRGSATGSSGGVEAATGGEESCVTGDEWCACYPDDTCSDGLTCSDDRCVRVSNTDAGTGAGPGSGVATGGRDAGTGGGEPSCSSVEPCGGDVVGNWTVRGSCLTRTGEIDISMVGVGCNSAPITDSALAVRGTWTAEIDGTYRDELVWTGEETFTLAPACLEVAGTLTTCDRLNGPISTVSDYLGLAYAVVTCVADPVGGCTCTAEIEQDARGATGTYQATGNRVTTSSGLVFAYCTDGHTVTLTPERWGETTTTTTTGTVVATTSR